jgi:hypothetical protein
MIFLGRLTVPSGRRVLDSVDKRHGKRSEAKVPRGSTRRVSKLPGRGSGAAPRRNEKEVPMSARKSKSSSHARIGQRSKKEITEEARNEMERGYSPTTAAGEFVHEEIHHVRSGKHGAKNPKQAIAIGLSKARRAGIPLKPQKRRS